MDSGKASYLKSVSVIAGLLVASIGAAVLGGWALDIPALTSVLPTLVTMKANTALGFVLSGVALALLAGKEPGRPLRIWLAGIAVMVAGLGAVTLGEYFFGWNPGIDQCLVHEGMDAIRTQPGRMAPATAYCFVLMGGALAAASQPLPTRLRLPILAGLGTSVAVIGGLALAGCASEAWLHAPPWNDSGMAIHTAAAFLLAGCGLVALAVGRHGLKWWLDAPVTIGFIVAIGIMVAATGISFNFTGKLLEAAAVASQTNSTASTFLIPPLGVFLSLTISSLGLFFLNTGVGERRGMEKAWRESEARLETVIDNVAEGLIICGLDGQLLHWNPAALTIHGFSSDEDGRGQFSDISRLFRLSTLDGLPLPLEQWPMSRVIGGERLHDVAARVRRVDIDTRDWERVFSYSGCIVRQADGTELAFLTMLDITERSRSEEALRASEIQLGSFVEQAPVAMAMFDRNMVYLAASRRWAIDYGAGHASLTGLCHYDIHPDMPQEWLELHRKGLAGIPSACDEEMWLHADGTKHWLRWAVQPWHDAHGGIGGIMILAENITDRKQAEQIQLDNVRLEEENRRVAEANRLKSEFLANMSHELRTPLNGIIGFTELMADERPGPLNRKQKEYLGDVLNSSRHLLQLINDVLDLAKVEAGKFDFQAETFNLGQGIEEVCAVVRGLAQKKQIKLTSEAPPGCVTMDQRRFKQICYNLLSNAVKFTNPGGSVEIIATDREAGYFEVRVTDTGIGIKPQDMERLFREFEQLDSGASRRFEGTGLGLALTRKLAELQGGRITACSEYGKGSCFTVVLPREVKAIVD